MTLQLSRKSRFISAVSKQVKTADSCSLLVLIFAPLAVPGKILCTAEADEIKYLNCDQKFHKAQDLSRYYLCSVVGSHSKFIPVSVMLCFVTFPSGNKP